MNRSTTKMLLHIINLAFWLLLLCTASTGIMMESAGSIASLPERNDMQPTLLRLKAPLMITEETEFEDRLKLLQKIKEEKAQRNARFNRKLNVKIIPTGGAKLGTPIDNICMDLDSEHLFTGPVLEKIHPPRDWEQRGVKCRQKISDICTTKSDVVILKEELEKRLKEFDTEEAGLCRKRRELYSQCFDEIIRQVTISCAERGKLLLAVRNEINVMFGAYESLFCSAVAYGIRKQLNLQKNIEIWKKKIQTLQNEIVEIEAIHAEFTPTYTHFETKFASQMEADEVEYNVEIERLLKNQQVLKKLLLNSVSGGNKEQKENESLKPEADPSYEFARKLSKINKEQPKISVDSNIY